MSVLSVFLLTSLTEAKDWRSGVQSGGAKKYTKDNSGGENNHKHSKNCKHNRPQKKYYRKTTRYWKYSGADNQGKLEHITESESNYEPRDRYYRK